MRNDGRFLQGHVIEHVEYVLCELIYVGPRSELRHVLFSFIICFHHGGTFVLSPRYHVARCCFSRQ